MGKIVDLNLTLKLGRVTEFESLGPAEFQLVIANGNPEDF